MKVGLIGCGHVAHLHAEVYRRLDDLEIVSVADIDMSKAKIFARKYSINRVFSDYFEVLEDKTIDFVDICTPTSTHAEISCNAAKAGLHILLEKPMAIDVEECNRMINESRRNQVKLCLIHNLLFFPALQLLRKMVDDGKYDVASLRTAYKISKHQNQFPKWVLSSAEKGILWELGYHLAYIQLEFLKVIENVYAYGTKLKYPVYDKIGALFSTPTLNYGVLEMSAISKQREFIVEMDSSDGSRVRIDIDKNAFTEMPQTQDMGRGYISRVKRYLASGTLSRAAVTKLGYSIGHYELFGQFVESLKNDKVPPVQPEDGREAINLLRRIEKSLSKN